MGKFQITYEWLRELLEMVEDAASVEMPGEQMRAVIRAAWKGMGYAPELPPEVFQYVPSANPNWLRYHKRRQAYEEHAKKARSKIRLVTDEEPKK